jgi:hypothetical protein
MTSWRYYLRSLVVVSVALAAVACNTARFGAKSTAEGQSQSNSKVVFVLFDLSASTEKPEVRQRYLTDFERIVKNLQSDDVIVADEITDNPLADSTFPINASIHKYNPFTDNDLRYNRQLGELRQQLVKDAEAILIGQGGPSAAPQGKGEASPPAGQPKKYMQTKILDSLELAQRVFATYQRNRQVLVIFSDMVEESEHYNFRHGRLTGARIQQIITQQKARESLPGLNGVQVYVAGAAQGAYGHMPSDQVHWIENFWMEYFKACGADLPRTRYGSALLEPPQ